MFNKNYLIKYFYKSYYYNGNVYTKWKKTFLIKSQETIPNSNRINVSEKKGECSTTKSRKAMNKLSKILSAWSICLFFNVKSFKCRSYNSFFRCLWGFSK